MSGAVLILGSGALASLFAARLAASGAEVTMLGSWPEGLAALNEHGVRLQNANGGERAYPVKASADPADCSGSQYALVLVKSWQTERAAKQLARCLTPDGVALTLQNGAGNRELLAGELGAERIAAGVTTTGATLVGPGRVRLGGEGIVSVGVHARLAPLVELLRAAGFEVEVVEDIEGLLWGKLVINAAINPLTALLGISNGEILTRPSARLLSAELAREATAVAAAGDLNLPFEDPVAAAEEVAERTAANRSSMVQDVERGAPTEIDAICGAIVSAGQEVGVPTPTNRVLWRLVKALKETPHNRSNSSDAAN